MATDAELLAARAAWPELALAPARVDAFLAERDPAGNVSDLYLACGCVDQLPAAIDGFDRHCGRAIERAVTAAGATGTEARDLAQIVRARLLVRAADGADPKIAGYTGRGSLVAWVKVVATRETHRLLARDRREQADDEAVGRLLAPDDDPELGFLKRVYRAEFKRACAAAIAALPDRDRLLLQQNALDGLTIDELAAQHAVHRATVARWIAAARDAVLAGTRAELIARLSLGTDEIASIMRLIASRLDVSLPRLLGRSG